VHALVGAEVHVKADTIVSNATVVMRDGWVVAVGRDASVPPDARVWDCRGRVIYPGFIEPLLPTGGSGAPLGGGSADDDNSGEAMTAAGGPYFGVAPQTRPKEAAATGSRLASVTPEKRMADGYAPDAKLNEELRSLGFTAANVAPDKGVYRGWSAVVTLGDQPASAAVLKPNTAQHVAFETRHDDQYPGSLMGVIAVLRQTAFDAEHDRAVASAGISLKPGSPRTARHPSLDALRPVLDGKKPVVIEAGGAQLEHRAWLLAGELGFQIQLVASGEEWRRPSLIREIAAAGVPFIAPVSFAAAPKPPEEADWDAIDLERLRAWDWAPENPALLRREGAKVAFTTFGLPDRKEFQANLRAAVDRGLSETDAIAGMTTEAARLCGVDDLLGTIEPGKLANLTITSAGGYFADGAKIVSVWVEGEPFPAPPESPTKSKDKEKQEKPDGDDAKKKKEKREFAAKRVAKEPSAGPGQADKPPAVVVENVTLWTEGPAGVLTNATLLVIEGKIAAAGAVDSARIPTNALHLRMPGAHVTPGVIDCHNHSMILGGVNEMTLPSTAMCRIGDVVNADTATIHEQLAGGVTMVNLLHGSANPIGGQNCVIKLREGLPADALKFTNAPHGIKFALGENVKQSNWGEKHTTRYPQTRMGVPVFYANRFTAAQQYLADWKAWNNGGRQGPGPRRDLEMEALGEILDGTRLIHCHSYRQDEILEFLRTMEAFNVRVGTLQHVLEGYKVADEIRIHGAGASCFADWWAYKYEVIDAIPHAGSLMNQRGVTVSFNSDSSDHARRLNLEAAKAIRYGGTEPAAALAFVTANPARQLHVEKWVGTLEPGKDADFAIWSGDPLDVGTICLQTWIEGVRYFDRASEPQRVGALADERAALVAKAKKMGGDGGEGAGGKPAGKGEFDLFFRDSLERARTTLVVDCMDAEGAR
jgi:imidazolonepropionase-like amidohydrolase